MKAELEPILIPDGGAWLSRRVELPRFDHPLHHHPEIELVWIGRSTGTWMIGDALGTFSPGDLYVLGSGLPHLFTHPSRPPMGAVAEVLQVRPDFFEGDGFHTPDMAPVRRLVAQASGGLYFSGASVCGRRLAELRQARGARRWALFFDLWDELTGRTASVPLAGPGLAVAGTPLQSESIQRVCDHILRYFDQDIRHGDMARLAHYSPAAFSRRFRQATRRTFTEFLTEVRLGHACTLLRETDWPVLRVALDSGFRNMSNFNRRFRERYHLTPRAYRNRLSE